MTTEALERLDRLGEDELAGLSVSLAGAVQLTRASFRASATLADRVEALSAADPGAGRQDEGVERLTATLLRAIETLARLRRPDGGAIGPLLAIDAGTRERAEGVLHSWLDAVDPLDDEDLVAVRRGEADIARGDFMTGEELKLLLTRLRQRSA